MKKKRKEEKKSRESALGWRFSLPREEQDPSQALAVACYSGKEEQQRVEEHSEELVSLAESCDITVLETRSWILRSPSSSTYLNEGKLLEIEEILKVFPTIGTLIVDEEITASQQRNLEKRLGLVVLDRTELILEIFANRAFTAEAGLQVELARARYLLPRLKRMWGHLSRQKSGGGSGGGFVKGEGEKQIELDRRMIRERIHKLTLDLKSVEKQRKERRKAKEKRGIPSFALIGYTNSGKSTLLNLLTSAETYVEDKLFATLDPKTRRCVLPSGQRVLVTDTVGFIRKLPHTLVAAFKSTLEAALHEDVLLHVVDASHPLAFEHIETTKEILKELGVDHPKIITVLNKIDALPHGKASTKLRLLSPRAVLISAKTGEGIQNLLEAMTDVITEGFPEVTLKFSYKDYGKFTELYDAGLVLSHRRKDDILIVEAYLPQELEKRYGPFIARKRSSQKQMEDEFFV
ncbi:GTPase HflX [Chlamydia psittaci]|uniref:GTPase HflX n=1 Tax=Chlamydia psittaci TaxID=83554 RepID=UPI0001F36287|nr:GTPase HflX [Chlamydia psittaci]AFS19272.1 GTP-binding proten HflX [Chlamydia psittaci 84/55]AFS22474.1 GTP-binding proten HflX [Chlamydia psittaci VS225]AGE74853.1 putative GTP-binding protein [Chlamydia psittaci Mat116]EPJ16096.1 GTP-binding protein HflX [Chlamydia psittaci 02DC18]EPJ17192.1 GTP-binding protein HflX [Chlamydia psittaci 02DC22]EPJ19953.1 GTP-binding protein HflX [Chlamydia psittaci 02DC23]EPJ21051.1 GTP-binding protein HflX [Chlamydia psittaci 02DC21]EPJ23956.1 GTP-bind